MKEKKRDEGWRISDVKKWIWKGEVRESNGKKYN